LEVNLKYLTDNCLSEYSHAFLYLDCVEGGRFYGYVKSNFTCLYIQDLINGSTNYTNESNISSFVDLEKLSKCEWSPTHSWL